MGAGVDLRVCAVRRDQVPHELERAQHMDRISLLQGLAHKDDPERVDVLVPDGVLEQTGDVATGRGFAVDVALGQPPDEFRRRLDTEAAADRRQLLLQGIGRFDWGDGLTLRAAVGATSPSTLKPMADVLMKFAGAKATWETTVDDLSTVRVGAEPLSVDLLREAGANTAIRTARHRPVIAEGQAIEVSGTGGRVVAMSTSVWVARDPFSLQDGASTTFHAEWDMNLPSSNSQGVGLVVDGRVRARLGDDLSHRGRDRGQADRDRGCRSRRWTGAVGHGVDRRHPGPQSWTPGRPGPRVGPGPGLDLGGRGAMGGARRRGIRRAGGDQDAQGREHCRGGRRGLRRHRPRHVGRTAGGRRSSGRQVRGAARTRGSTRRGRSIASPRSRHSRSSRGSIPTTRSSSTAPSPRCSPPPTNDRLWSGHDSTGSSSDVVVAPSARGPQPSRARVRARWPCGRPVLSIARKQRSGGTT